MPEKLAHLEARLLQSRQLAENATDSCVRISHQQMSARYVERVLIEKTRLNGLVADQISAEAIAAAVMKS